jgi:hypothetical protein
MSDDWREQVTAREAIREAFYAAVREENSALRGKLRQIYDLVDSADWQNRAKYPEQFAPWCGEILRIIDIDNVA